MILIEIPLIGISISELVAWVVAVLIGLAAAIKAISEIVTLGFKPAVKKLWEWIVRQRTRRKKMDELSAKFDERFTELQSYVVERGAAIDRIDAELRTNGGSSVKDMVCRIDRKVEHIQARVRHQDETSMTPIFELNERGSLTFANCAFCDLVDADEKELFHRDYVSRMHEADKTGFLAALKEAIDNLMPLDTPVRYRLSKGGIVQIRVVARPDVRPDGQLMGFFGTAAKVDV